MARIRTIKPEFWTDEKIVELSPFSRLLFIGLWNFADDEGRMVFSLGRIKMQIFPGDSLDISELFGEIRGKLVEIYTIDNIEYLQITGFSRHQKIDKRMSSKYPAPPIPPDSPRFTPTPPDSPRRNGRDQGMECIKERNGMDQGVTPSLKTDLVNLVNPSETKNKPIALVKVIIPPIQIPDWIPVDAWNDFVDSRKKLKKPLTQVAIKLAISSLSKLKSEGSDPKEVLEQSILNGYSGLFPVKSKQLIAEKTGGAYVHWWDTEEATHQKARQEGVEIIDDLGTLRERINDVIQSKKQRD